MISTEPYELLQITSSPTSPSPFLPSFSPTDLLLLLVGLVGAFIAYLALRKTIGPSDIRILGSAPKNLYADIYLTPQINSTPTIDVECRGNLQLDFLNEGESRATLVISKEFNNVNSSVKGKDKGTVARTGLRSRDATIWVDEVRSLSRQVVTKEKSAFSIVLEANDPARLELTGIKLVYKSSKKQAEFEKTFQTRELRLDVKPKLRVVERAKRQFVTPSIAIKGMMKGHS